ncbi:MAG: hypothetical protein CMJ25_15285 [Phycisphaerae bacterium]|nr:hypothetical protein [Phycisphaerae bacterium]
MHSIQSDITFIYTNTQEEITMQQFHVIQIKRLTNTTNGNARFEFICRNCFTGQKVNMKTRGNAMWACAISSAWEGRSIYAETKTTKKTTFIENAKLV